jgi:hypothetical protein
LSFRSPPKTSHQNNQERSEGVSKSHREKKEDPGGVRETEKKEKLLNHLRKI